MEECEHVTENNSKSDVKLNKTHSKINVPTDFVVSFAISGLLAIVFKTILAPLERIKLILQTQTSSRQIERANRTPYSGFFDAFVRIPQEQGILSLWRGNVLTICRYFPMQAINFSFFDIYNAVFKQIFQPKTLYGHNLLPFLSGGAVGLTTCVVLFPLKFCNTRISVDVGDNKTIEREFLNLRDCLCKVYKNDGIKGFYQGVCILATGTFLYRSAYFGIYTISKRMYLNLDMSDSTIHTIQTPFLVSVLLAQLSSFLGTVIAYPLDTIGRQKMLWSGYGLKHYATTRQVIARIIEKDGLLGLYKGVFASFLTNVCGSCILVSYDVIKGHYEQSNEPKVASNRNRSQLRSLDDW